jgi:hypothetical protein
MLVSLERFALGFALGGSVAPVGTENEKGTTRLVNRLSDQAIDVSGYLPDWRA